MKWLVLLALFLVFQSESFSWPGLPYSSKNLLLIEIGRYETRGHPNPSQAEGAFERVGRKRQRPIGRYQIQEATARDLGFNGTRKSLFNDEIGGYWAQRYLDLIKHRLEHACGRHGATLRAIAYGYPHGHNALRCNPPVGAYHDTIALAVVAHRLQAFKNWNLHRKIVLVRL